MTDDRTEKGSGGEEKLLGWMYDKITGEEDARVCKDIPDAACRHQPRNFFGYLLGNTFSKIADELSSARLILPWLLGVLGAPTALVGFLVPIREAGVLLPQLLVAALVRRMPRRKKVWLIGAALSGLSLVGMAWAAFSLSGLHAGLVLVGLLVIYSLARGICSVSAKDVLGKTVSKTRRGTLMGYSSGLSGIAVFGLGAALILLPGLTQDAVIMASILLGAAGCWIVGLLGFSGIREEAGATEGGGNALSVAFRQLTLVRTDYALQQFIIARALLLSLALMPPFYVLLVQRGSSGAIGLGGLIIASGLASALSAPVWGRLSDRSSRQVMMLASGLAGISGLVLWAGASWFGDAVRNAWLAGALYTLVMICHGGVRLARKAHLVDMASAENRAAYVAVSNTVIGVLMLAGGLVGMLGDLWNTPAVIGVLSLVALLAVIQVYRMEEVQQR